MTTLYWLRNDLRLSDNPALSYAAEQGTVLPVYILDKRISRQMGAASLRWLHDSLESINKDLQGKLLILAGDPQTLIPDVVHQYDIENVVWNRLYEPETVARDSDIKKQLLEQGVQVRSFNANHLWQPTEIAKKDGTPYKVFTPYYRKGCLVAGQPRFPLAKPEVLKLLQADGGLSVSELNLLPAVNWDEKMMSYWHPGEAGAKELLADFLAGPLFNYKNERNLPAVRATSRLSPHLHFGELSPNQVWYAIVDKCNIEGVALDSPDVDCYLSELGWREFSAYLLFHFPQMVTQNFNEKFDKFPWRAAPQHLQAWQKGQTGFPIVDAGMRELWATGYMHNRVRMIVGSFLVKNLLLDWRQGEAWFWDCLMDADLASNVASWQWVAGSGADAAPYFRIFNPVTQGEKFDPDGDYVKTWCPELGKVPPKLVHKIWEADANLLSACGVKLGQNYPNPIVDLKASRQRALDAFADMKEAQ
ncbi:cryptochrome/photolyase family protein [Planctobacterium marinum]|uniref:cryptochrome/photolyase family protein n=1 Tax=Planctobacterium marinum TaxID=1631968 RepID=UPI001E60CD36|nr:deoxyribodipyrimidine photo-lyase [Planctobacterium marinum]MCC2607405.1 DNA photolyase family protein [Planctobacterium marinum]